MIDELKQWEYDRGYEKGKTDVLDKIRDKIYLLHHHPKLDFIKNDDVVDMALEIIDEYRKEVNHETDN